MVNNSTSKWIIALAISIILAIGGWAFAAVNGTKAGLIEKHSVKIEINATEIGELKTQGSVIATKLEYIIEDLKEIKDAIKRPLEER